MEHTETIGKLRDNAIRIFQAGVAAVEPHAAVTRFCRRQGNIFYVNDRPFDLNRIENIYVVGAGKAGAPMVDAVMDILGGRITGGSVTVKYGHVTAGAVTSDVIQMVEAGHPSPDAGGQRGSEAIMSLASKAGEKDLVICLISGGGSALMPLPAGKLTQADKQAATKTLLACGATIHEINTIRKHISKIKGGRLARVAYPASVVSLILSDVVGDDLDVIASGPTVPDKSTFHDCLKIIGKYDISNQLPDSVMKYLEDGVKGTIEETPKVGDPAFERTENIIIGSNLDALLAARKTAREMGFNTLVLSSRIQGDTTQSALFHSAIVKEIIRTGHPVNPPACILSGGETTVRIMGEGLGGRNQEFALVSAMEIAEAGPVVVLSGGTDGTDGPTDAAGGIVDSETISKAMKRGLDPSAFLNNNDSYHFLEKVDVLLKTGPTFTNVMDLRILLAG